MALGTCHGWDHPRAAPNRSLAQTVSACHNSVYPALRHQSAHRCGKHIRKHHRFRHSGWGEIRFENPLKTVVNIIKHPIISHMIYRIQGNHPGNELDSSSMSITGPPACVIKHGWPGNPRLVEVLHGCLVAQSSIYIYIHTHTHIYIYTYTHTHTYIYIYIYINIKIYYF